MGNSCIYIPTVKVGGKEVESKLFRDLLSFTGSREESKYLWAITQIPEYVETLQGIQRDENGEPTLESLNKALNIENIVQGKTSLLAQKRDIGAVNSNNNPVEYNSFDEIIGRVNDFNQNNPTLVASIHKNIGKYGIQVDYKTPVNSEVPNELMFKNNLNNRLRNIMKRLGFDAEVINNPTHDGVFDPLNAETTAEGLRKIIQIAKGQRGEEAFPEEFSHLIIEGLMREPLVKRLVDSLQGEEIQREVLGEQYDSYFKLYNGNTLLMQKEAAGKMLARQIINQGVNKERKNLIGRLWDRVKRIFGQLQVTDIDEAINEANQGFARLASAVMDESILPLFDGNQLTKASKLYKVGQDITNLEKLSRDALELVSRRLKIAQLRSKNKQFTAKEVALVKNLQNTADKKQYNLSLLSFLKDATEVIDSLNQQFKTLTDPSQDGRSNSDLSKISRMSQILRGIKEFTDGYAPIIKNLSIIDKMQQRGEIDLTTEDAAKISALAADLDRTISDVQNQYRSNRFNTVFNFLKLYWGEDKIIQVGKDKGQKVTLELIMDMAMKDIGIADRWLSSLGDASDPMLSLVDKVVKTANANRGAVLEDLLYEIRGHHNKLSRSGEDTNFMYERDENGNLTGRIISDIDFIRFEKEKAEFKKQIKKNTTDGYTIMVRMQGWEASRTKAVVVDKKEGRVEILPDPVLYKKEVIGKLNPVQREYYDNMIRIKAAMDSFLPQRYVGLYNAVQIRKDMMEAVTGNLNDPKKAAKIVVENIKEKFMRREDDVDFGAMLTEEDGFNLTDEYKTVMRDFAGKDVQKLPVYYTSPLKDMDMLSTDFTSSLVAYSGMATNYFQLNKIIDALELTRDLVQERKVQQMSGDHKVVEFFKIMNKTFSKKYTEEGAKTAIGARLNDYYTQVIYGKYKNEGTNIKGTSVNTAKTGDTLKHMSSVINLGVNLFSGIGNVIVGDVQALIEAAGGEYYTAKDFIVGTKNYFALIPEALAELNSTKVSSKLALLSEKFDSLEDFYAELRRQNYYKSKLARIFGNSTLFFLNRAGEHYLHNRTMLALLNNYKVKDRRGQVMSLFEAFEVEKHIVDGKNLGGRLKLKEGVRNLDGSELTDDTITQLRFKIGKVNQALNGAFNAEDKGAVHQYVLARLAMQFRQWMVGHFSRRLAGTYYDAQLGQYREGYYNTAWRFTQNLVKDLVRAKFEMATHWKQLNPHEKANLKRSLTEIGIFAVLKMLLALAGPEKDRKGKWAERMLLYQLKRLKVEVGVSVPWTDFIKNWLTLVQTPMPAVKQADNLINLLNITSIFNEIEGGRYKGQNEYWVNLMRLMPILGQARKVKDITEEDYMFTMFNK